MIYSMTGYAAASVELESGSLSLELRAVNHRYLDLQVRMPDELRMMEMPIRDVISKQLSRGKAECRINFYTRPMKGSLDQLNYSVLENLALLEQNIRNVFPASTPLSVAEILRCEGVMDQAVRQQEPLDIPIMELLNRVLSEFTSARAREGEKLKEFLLARVDQIESCCVSVGPRIPASIAAYEEKLSQRLSSALVELDDERLRQELVLFANKIDVDEELSRLKVHLSEIRRVLDQGGAVGKRLDFLMQELHREANTLGSKSVDTEISRASMEMKLLIEQMREQIQNLE